MADVADEPNAAARRRLCSDRTAIRSVLMSSRDNGDLGRRAVVGGWVFSARKEPKELPSTAEDLPMVLCRELMTHLPALRCIVRILFGAPKNNGSPAPEKAAGAVAVLWINDGSCAASLQAVVDSSLYPAERIAVVGNSVVLEGVLQSAEAQGAPAVELKVDRVLHVGAVDVDKYPLYTAAASPELLRAHPHLRVRSPTVASAARIRSGLANAIHAFFSSNGFFHVNPPVITTKKAIASAFYVTLQRTCNDGGDKLVALRSAVDEKTLRLEELKRSCSNREAVHAMECDLNKTAAMARQLESELAGDYLGVPAYLLARPGLHLEAYACAMSSVYTFCPVFNDGGGAQSSEKQLAETWVADAEIAFAELEEAMNVAEECLKSLCRSVLDLFADDLKLLSANSNSELVESIATAASSHPFERITYAEAVEKLTLVAGETPAFERGVAEMADEHQRCLGELYKRPIIVYNFSKKTKPFFARSSDDGSTVSAFDIAVPKAGTVVSGSQKEERLDQLMSRIDELGLPKQQLEWYLDLRRHGSPKRSGFTIDFNKLSLFLTGADDARDAVPFPRARGEAKL